MIRSTLADPDPGRPARPGSPGLAAGFRTIAARAASALALATATLVCPAVASADDSQPAQWIHDANAVALQHAPPPAEKPVICVVDYGVNETPDLDIVSRQAIDGGTVDDVSARPGTYGHGTTVAHMAAGKVNGWGGSGVFPHARIASVRIFPREGERVPWAAYVRGLEKCWEVQPRPVVVVLSLGAPTASDEEALDLLQAIGASADRYGMSVVAAAGNSGGAPDMPARIDRTMSVGAHGSRGRCAFSAVGGSIDLTAPGCDVIQAGWNEEQWRLNGTSFAAPIVAGALAALRSYRPGLSVHEAEQLLRTQGAGSTAPLDVQAAFSRAQLEWIAAPSSPNSNSASAPALMSSFAPGPASVAAAAEAPVSAQSRQYGQAPPARPTRILKERPRRLSRPRVRLRRFKSTFLVTISGRRSGQLIEIRTGGRVLHRTSSVIRLRRARGRIAVRLVDDFRVSHWVFVE
jgi:serine protease